MNVARIVMVMTVAAALAGCETLRSTEPGGTAPSPEPSVTPPAGNVDGLLAYFQRIRKLTATELGNEHERARLAFMQQGSDVSRMRLAMVLSLPNTTFNSDPRALDLLDPMVKNQDSTLHGLALLLSAYLQEHRRLDNNVQNLQQTVQGLQQNILGLQQKLDALKSLDRSLMEREQGGAARKR